MKKETTSFFDFSTFIFEIKTFVHRPVHTFVFSNPKIRAPNPTGSGAEGARGCRLPFGALTGSFVASPNFEVRMARPMVSGG